MKTLPAVFVVDDEAEIRKSFEMFLGIMNIPHRSFPSADEFLAAYDAVWTGLALVDIRMTGINGLELVKELRARNSSLAAILMTGNADEAPEKQALDAGAVAFLQKPFSINALKEILKHYLPTT